MINYIKKFIAGMAVGIANIIPGISGGTIAVVFNVYDDLINIAAFNIKKIKSQWINFLCLIGGIGCGILIFAKLFKLLYERYPIHVNFFFVGLIFGSITILFDFVKEEKKVTTKTFIKLFWFSVGFTIMLAMYFFKGATATTPLIIETLSVKNIAYLFGSGIIGAIAMVVPGISGSFILLILGLYYPIIKAITNFNLPILLIVGLGIILGIFISARTIKLFLTKYPKITYAFILGLVAGSIIHIFPIVCQQFYGRLISAMCLLSGYILINVFEKINKNNME